MALLLGACGTRSDAASEPIVVSPPPGDEAPAERLAIGEDACASDADCVPAECCHAAACVARERAPSCEDAMCSAECRYGTIDCGGGCLCYQGRCAARLSEPPDLEVEEPAR